jgi:hypothetical protein
MPASPAKPAWSALKRKLQPLARTNLLEVVKALFELSAENRDLLAARFLGDTAKPTESGNVVLRPYRERIRGAFYDRGGWPRTDLQLTAARKAIRDYRKATTDPEGTLDLMVEYVETGTGFSLDFGAEDEPLFNSLSSVLGDIETACGGLDGAVLYAEVRERLKALADRARWIGWGYGDEVQDLVGRLEARYGDSFEEPASSVRDPSPHRAADGSGKPRRWKGVAAKQRG